jgi:cephalosporin hydroxylase
MSTSSSSSSDNAPGALYFEGAPGAHPGYLEEKKDRVSAYSADGAFRKASQAWQATALEKKYMNNFSWLGRPIIQMPCDIIAIQELIWQIKPRVVIETGVAHGGSLIFHASILELLGQGEVLGIDIEIRPHNRKAIEEHPLGRRIRLFEGSSTAAAAIEHARDFAGSKSPVMVILDSNHTHEHVLAELRAYASLVTPQSYCVVMDSFIEDMPAGTSFTDRPWKKGDNPKTAIHAWLPDHPEFVIDRSFEDRLQLSACPDGFLKRMV